MTPPPLIKNTARVGKTLWYGMNKTRGVMGKQTDLRGITLKHHTALVLNIFLPSPNHV